MKPHSTTDSGSAILTAVLISTVMVVMSLTAVALSVHNQQASGADRDRISAIHAAESGFDLATAGLQNTEPALLPCVVKGELDATPRARYEASIEYYESWPLTGTPMNCRLVGGPIPAGAPEGSAAVSPGGALIRSVGTVWNSGRTLEGAVRLTPILGQFNKALFSDETPVVENNVDIYGQGGIPADIYTNGDWNCASGGISVSGSVYAQGGSSLDRQCQVADNLWVRNALTMGNNSTVGANAVSSMSSITLANSAEVGGHAIAALACNGCTEDNVKGSISVRGLNNVPDPPQFTMPAVPADVAAWQAAGYTPRYESDCEAARTWLTAAGGITAKTILRITPACTLALRNKDTITLKADLVIMTDGSITTDNLTIWKSDGTTQRILHLIVPSSVEPYCSPTIGNVSFSNQTQLHYINYFVYSPCSVTFMNNNTNGTSAGQIYGGELELANHLQFWYAPVFMPGVPDRVIGFATELAYLREVNT